MLNVIVALALVIVFLVPAIEAFASDETGNGGDRTPQAEQELAQPEPATAGTVAGPDTPYVGPYFEQRLENRTH